MSIGNTCANSALSLFINVSSLFVANRSFCNIPAAVRAVSATWAQKHFINFGILTTCTVEKFPSHGFCNEKTRREGEGSGADRPPRREADPDTFDINRMSAPPEHPITSIGRAEQGRVVKLRSMSHVEGHSLVRRPPPVYESIWTADRRCCSKPQDHSLPLA